MGIVSQTPPDEAGTLPHVAPCAQLPDHDPWSTSHPFLQAAQWLREQAPVIAEGSRDFGRGFALAATMLDDAATPADGMPLASRFKIARSLLERVPSEHVCRLIAALMQGATLAELIDMELEA